MLGRHAVEISKKRNFYAVLAPLTNKTLLYRTEKRAMDDANFKVLLDRLEYLAFRVRWLQARCDSFEHEARVRHRMRRKPAREPERAAA
jgi:hypothetical protein